jgi:hypothetical protein
VRIIPTRLLTWVRRVWPRIEVARSDTVAETGWDLLPFSFRVDWFVKNDDQRFAPTHVRNPVSVEAFARLNALWEAQNWSTGGELHLSPDEFRNGIRAFADASNDAFLERLKEGDRDDAQDFYVRKPTRDRRMPPCGGDTGQGPKP